MFMGWCRLWMWLNLLTNLKILRTPMNLSPRHLAAIQYTIIATFHVASWWVLLSPVERARGQLEFILASEYENRNFFIWLVIATIITTLMAMTFWLKRATTASFSALLAFASAILLGGAIKWFDSTFIVTYSLGFVCSLWSWGMSKSLLKTDNHQVNQR